MLGFPKKIKLKDGRIAVIKLLNEKDSASELQKFINAFVDERAFLLYDRKQTLKEEREWKKRQLALFRKRESFNLIARVDGKIAGTAGAHRGQHKARNNAGLGIAIAKPFRGVGLGEAMLKEDIAFTRRFLKPKTIYLSVLGPNRAARSLYEKLGFKKFAVFPRWMDHYGKFVDQVFMKLK